MSNLLMSGFETGTSVDFFTSATLNAASGVSSTYRRGAFWAMYTGSANDRCDFTFSTSQTDLYAQLAIIWTGTTPAAATGTYIKFFIGSAVMATLKVNDKGRIDLYLGDGAVLKVSGSTPLLQYRWYNIEVHFKFDASGVLECRLDGVAEGTPFNGESRYIAEGTCVARYRLESGALTHDSAGSTDLTNYNTVTADGTNYMEGGYAALFSGSNSLYCTDTNLAAGFPFKTGDSNLKGSFCFWFRPTTFPGAGAYYNMVTKWDYAGHNISFGVAVFSTTGTLRITWGWNAGSQSFETYDPRTLTLNQWYHIGVTFDGNGKLTYVRVWDQTAQTVTSYSKAWTNVMRPANASPFIIGSETPSTGEFKGQIDEVLVYNGVLMDPAIDSIRINTFTGFANSFVTQFEVLNPAANALYWDDIVINNSSGSFNNSWPDKMHIVGLSPRADVVTGWTVESQTDAHWKRACAYPLLQSPYAARIFSTTTAGVTEQFSLENVPIGISDVPIVQTVLFTRSAITTLAPAITVLHTLVSVGGTVFESTDINLTSTFAWYKYTWESNPVTSTAWTATDLNNLQYGVKSIR